MAAAATVEPAGSVDSITPVLMSKLARRKSISGAATEPALAAPQQQNASEIIRPASTHGPRPISPMNTPTPTLARSYPGAEHGRRLYQRQAASDNASAFAKGAFEAHGAAVQAAKAPPITA